jgi:hypothetical protein
MIISSSESFPLFLFSSCMYPFCSTLLRTRLRYSVSRHTSPSLALEPNHPSLIPFGRADYRLLDIVHSDSKLYLVFEFLDCDLKKYMDTHGGKDGLAPGIVKVSHLQPDRASLVRVR